MESSEDVEVMSRAIEKLLVEKRKREADFIEEDEDDQLLLSSLISQLESPNPFQEKESSLSHKQLEENIEEIAKDIKEVKRQNKVTHVLLSALIILTLTWQLSEYSMIFMMKERLSHPVKSIGSMLSGMFKGKIGPVKTKLPVTNTSGSKEEDNNHHNGNVTNNGVRIQVPELLRDFGFEDDDE
ncbi:unnamed protein product [Cochlearia groenlandica]